MKFCIFCMYGYSRSWYNDLGRRWTRFVVIEKSERLHFSIHILIFRWRNGCKWASRLELQARLITYLNDIAGDFIPIPKWNSRGRNCPDDQLNKLNLLEIVIDFYLSSNSRTYIYGIFGSPESPWKYLFSAWDSLKCARPIKQRRALLRWRKRLEW